MADFSTWQRENLERLAKELTEDNLRLREENKVVLMAWRKAITELETRK